MKKTILHTLLILAATIAFIGCEQVEKKPHYSLLDLVNQESAEASKKETTTKTKLNQVSQVHYGIDVSHFQGDIIEKLKQSDSLRFAICKATQGQYFVDPEFHYNWNEIKDKGLVRGTYHFYDCSVDPEVQASHFFNTVKSISATDIAPVLDIEQGSMSAKVSGKKMVSDILIFLKSVHQKFGRKPILYTDYAFAQEYFTKPELANYDLWLAEYESSHAPKIPDLWKSKGYFIWQKSAHYKFESTSLDYDEFKGPLSNIVK